MSEEPRIARIEKHPEDALAELRELYKALTGNKHVK